MAGKAGCGSGSMAPQHHTRAAEMFFLGCSAEGRCVAGIAALSLLVGCLALTGGRLLEYDGTDFGICVVEEANIL